jgi:hypothetical protein
VGGGWGILGEQDAVLVKDLVKELVIDRLFWHDSCKLPAAWSCQYVTPGGRCRQGAWQSCVSAGKMSCRRCWYMNTVLLGTHTALGGLSGCISHTHHHDYQGGWLSLSTPRMCSLPAVAAHRKYPRGKHIHHHQHNYGHSCSHWNKLVHYLHDIIFVLAYSLYCIAWDYVAHSNAGGCSAPPGTWSGRPLGCLLTGRICQTRACPLLACYAPTHTWWCLYNWKYNVKCFACDNSYLHWVEGVL